MSMYRFRSILSPEKLANDVAQGSINSLRGCLGRDGFNFRTATARVLFLDLRWR